MPACLFRSRATVPCLSETCQLTGQCLIPSSRCMWWSQSQVMVRYSLPAKLTSGKKVTAL
jgi:hypothetical protein